MCLISIAPKGTIKDSEEVFDFISEGAKSNRDGSGFMYKRSGENKITIDKGYFDIEKLKNKIKVLKLTEDDELVIHHRNGTSGDVTRENTHPFVITDKEDEISEIDITINKPCLVHNGVFWGIKEFERLNPVFSDTYAFTRYIMPDLLPILENNKKLFNYLTNSLIGTDKLCILYPNKDLVMLGNYIEKNGYYHSNNGYCKYEWNRGNQSENFMNTTIYKYPNVDTGFNLPVVVPNKPNILNLEIDDKTIRLNKKNYFHFAFVRKEFFIKSPLTCRRFELDNFENDTTNEVLYDCESEKKRGIAISKEKIKSEFFIIPKNEDYKEVYKEYLNLVKKQPTFTKNCYKKIRKQLDNNYNLTNFDLINCTKVSRKIPKLSLSLYIDYLERITESKMVEVES